MTEDREIAVRGTKIRYRDSGGSGPVVLLTHGIGLMLEIWEPTAAALCQSIPRHKLGFARLRPFRSA